MLVAISWSLVLLLTALYSLGLWLAHAFAVWSLTSVGALAGDGSVTAGQSLPSWVSIWIPSEWMEWVRLASESFGPWVQTALSALPSLAHWLTPIAWVVWAFGVLLLLAGGGLVHGLTRMARRSSIA